MYAQQPISKWWPIGLGIASVVLFAVGGGLVGSSAYTDGYYIYINTGMYYGGIAICALASFAFIAFIVMFILYFVRRNKTAQHVENGHGVVNYAQPQTAAPYQQPAMAKPEPVVMTNMTNQMAQNETKFCGNCGAAANSRFCVGCGATVPGM